MYFEFAALLRAAIVKVYPQSIARRQANLWRWPHIIACPPCEDSLLGSGVAFEITAENDSRDPYVVAAELIEICNAIQAKAGLVFVLKIGGDGYINADVSDLFYSRFFSAVSSRGVEVLFAPDSFIVDVESASACGATSIRVKSDERELHQRAKKCDDENRLFIEGVLGRPPAQRPVQERLMMLALLGCEDLGPRSYRLGLNGRENVPWYVGRFLKDSMRYLELLQGHEEISNARAIGRPEELPQELREVVAKIFRFRHLLFRAVQHADEPIVVWLILDLIRGFYDFYNQPRYRAPALQQLGQLREITTLLNSVVKRLLGLLDFPCNDGGLALEM